MAKFHKLYFISPITKEKQVFSYNIPIPKRYVEKAELQDVKVTFRVDRDKIVIERDKDEANNS